MTLADPNDVRPRRDPAALAAEEDFERRAEPWRKLFVIETEEDRFHFRTLVASALLAEVCRNEEAAVRAHLALRAERIWDADRRREAVRLGDRLAKKPELVVAELTATPHGCDWLIGRWEGLGRAAEQGGEWTPEQTALAFDLLGAPAEFRAGTTPFARGQSPAQLVSREIEALRDLKDSGLVELDDHRREMTAQGFDPERNPHIDRLRRCEQAALRRYRWALSLLKRADGGTADSTHVAAPTPAVPVAPPPPEPPPGPPTEADYQAAEREFWQRALTDESPNFLDVLSRLAGNLDAATPPPATPTAPISSAHASHRVPNRKMRREADRLARKGR